MTSKGGKTMFARITTMEFRMDNIDKVIKIFKESVVPAAKLQKGFVKIYFFLNRETGKGHSITLWENQEDVVANEKNLYYQEQLVKFLPFYKSDPVKEGFEVIVDE
jgi:heme-degrading monooxygenase HmoA